MGFNQARDVDLGPFARAVTPCFAVTLACGLMLAQALLRSLSEPHTKGFRLLFRRCGML